MNGKRTGMGLGMLAASGVVVLVVATVLGLRRDRDLAEPAAVALPETASQPEAVEDEPDPQVRTEVVVPPQVLARQAEAATAAPLVAATGFVVVDSLTKEPLLDVDWWLDHASAPQEGYTESDGRIVVGEAGLQAVLLLHREGYARRGIRPTEHESLPLREDGFRTITLTPAGRLDVRVVDEQGAPVVAAHIDVQPYLDPRKPRPEPRLGWPYFQSSRLVRTDTKGRDFVNNRTNLQGRMSVSILPVGEPLQVELGSERVEQSKVVTIDPSTRHASAEFVLARRGAVRGRIVDLTGHPVDGLRFRLIGPGNQRSDRASPPWGEFSFERLDAGDYALVIDGNREPIAVRVDGAIVDLGDVVATGSCVVEGNVLFPTDGPKLRDEVQVSTLLIKALTPGFEPVRLSVDGNGHFAGRMNPGPFSYAVLYVGGRVLLLGEATAPAADLTLDIHELTSSLRFRLPAVADLQVELNFYDLSSEWRADARPKSTLAASCIPQPEASVRVRAIPSGPCSLRITSRDRGAAWISPLQFTLGATLDIGAIELGFASVTGTLSDPAGQPRAEVELLAVSRLDRDVASTRTDAKGAYEFRGLKSGAYEIRSTGSLPGTGIRVELRAGEMRQVDNLSVDVGGGVRGRVQDHGAPIVGAQVRVDVNFTDSRTKVPEGTTDAAGAFQVDALSPGQRLLAIQRWLPNGKVDFLGLVDVAVRLGEISEVDIDVGTGVELEVLLEADVIADATSLTLFGPGRNERRFAPDSQGRFRIPVSSEPRIARVQAPRFRLANARSEFAEASVLALLVGSAEPRQQLSLPKSPVRVPCASEQPPNVRLFSVDGIPTLFLSVSAVSCAPVRWTKTEFELEHVPVGAELEVERIDAARGRVVERLRVHADGVARP